MTILDKRVEPRFTCPLAHWMDEYIRINRAIGNKYNLDAIYLKQLDTYCNQQNMTEVKLSREIFDGWCSK